MIYPKSLICIHQRWCFIFIIIQQVVFYLYHYQVVLLLPLLLVPLVDSTSDASTFPILRFKNLMMMKMAPVLFGGPELLCDKSYSRVTFRLAKVHRLYRKPEII